MYNRSKVAKHRPPVNHKSIKIHLEVNRAADVIEPCLAALTAALVFGRYCVEGSLVSVRSGVACAHFVSD